MSQQVDQLFIDIFESEVHHAYQREGAKFETMVRQGGQGPGKRVWFPKMGKAAAVSKSRHADVPIADRNETGVWCNIVDAYHRDMIDDLDEVKTNVNARQEYARDHAWILGRFADEQIITAMAATTNGVSGVGSAITLAVINGMYQHFGDNAIPVDGNRFCAVSPKGWTDLQAIPQFSNADYVPEGEMPYRGSAGNAKRWFSFYWFTQEGTDADDGALPKTGDIRTSLAWHRRAVGYHKQTGPSTEVARNTPKQGWDLVTQMACGSIIIDEAGVFALKHDETVIPT